MLLRLACPAMGTRFELVLVGEAEAELQAAGDAALEEIRLLHRLWSRFERDSLVSHLARSAGTAWTQLDPETWDLLEAASQVSMATGGAFAPILEQATGVPASCSVEEGIERDEARQRLRLARPGLTLDLGAIAKGAALDTAAAILADAGVRSALLHGGTSTITTLAAPPSERGWNISLGEGSSSPVFALDGDSLSVSALHQVGPDGLERRHIHGPASPQGPMAAAVRGPRATLCDAWSTALVAGADPSSLPHDYTAMLKFPGGTWLPLHETIPATPSQS